MYKLIAADMDGTLLTNSGEISEKTIEYINYLKQKGVVFVPASGRAPNGLEDYKKILNHTSPVICSNGAYAEVDGKVVFEKELLPDDAKKILDLGQKYNASMFIWSKNRLYTNGTPEKIEKYEKMAHTRSEYKTDFSDLLAQGITKILWFSDEEKIAKIRDEINPKEFSKVTYLTSCPFFLEFFNADASKGKALIEIGKAYCIAPSEMIAIGDGENDISMLEAVGLGGAMHNASDKVKASADFITLSNEEDGVAYVIEKFI